MRKLLLFTFAILFALQSWAQNRTVTGKVTDEKGAPVVNATVTAAGLPKGVVTNNAGQFSVVVPDGVKFLVVSYVGRETIQLQLGAAQNYNVTLKPDNQQSLSEVVVVGYQTMSKKDVVGSLNIISNKEIAEKPIANFTQLLQGTTPGMQVTGASGRPGAGANIRIRGTGSINASSQPLIMIDGMQVSTAAYAVLNPNDIQELSVLKDAAATAIYGSRGANGVILVTTKKGKAGAAVVTYNFQYGEQKAQALQNVKLMDARQKLQYEYEFIKGGGSVPNPIIDSMIKNRIAKGYFPTGSTLLTLSDAQRAGIWDTAASRGAGDWNKYMLQKGLVRTHEVSVSGGADKFSYYLSLQNSDQDGVVYHSFFKRKGGKLNVEFKPHDWLRVGTNLGVYATKDNTVRELNNGQAAYTSALALNGYEPVYNADGSFNYTKLGQNAMETIDRNPDVLDRITTFANVFAEAKALKHLTLKSQLGLNYNTLSEEYYLQPGSYLALTLGYNQKRDNGNRDFLYVFTNTANWNQTFNGQHSLNALIGTEFNKDKFYSYSLTARGFPTASVTTLENGSTPFATTSSRRDWSMISYFGRVGYDFEKKYFLEFSGRRDGSSKFGANVRFANFWAVGASWDVLKESFLKVKQISNLRLRGSLGTAGNSNGFGEYDALGTYALNVNYNQQPAASPSAIANPELTWEKNKSYDAGLEIGLFNNRLNAGVDYYNRRTTSLIYDVNLSLTTGFSSYRGNIGGMRNKGVELSLNGDVVRNKDLTVNLFVNYTHNDNKVTDLYSDNVPNTAQGGLSYNKIGEPLNVYSLVRWAGVNPETGKNEYYKLDGTKTTTYASSDATILSGKSAQVKYYGSFGTNVSYKGFDLSARFYYSGGNYIMNYMYSILASEGESISKNQLTDALNYWKKPGDIAPMANLADKTQWATYDTDKYLEKGDYVSLRDITIAYNLSSELASKIKLKGLRVFAQGTNLWTATKFRGIPELGESNREQTTLTIPGQTTLFSYPQFRAITVGVNVKL